MTYSHTQRSLLHYLFLLPVAVLAVAAFFVEVEPAPRGAFAIIGCVLLLFSFSFQNLTVEDRGDRLRVRFGPLPLFQKSIEYDDISKVKPARSSIIDGWGIHWVPGRGWTWNLWGFDCVEITYKNRLLRIGTDDPQGLAEFLRGRTAT